MEQGHRAVVVVRRVGRFGAKERAALIADASARGIAVLEVVYQSGRFQRDIARVRELALCGTIDTLMVSSLATLGREAVALQVAAELTALGVRIFAGDAPWISECGSVLHDVAAWLIEQSRVRRSAQSRASLSRARASGTILGRPRKSIAANALDLVNELGIAKAARELDLGESTLRRFVAASRAAPPSLSNACTTSAASYASSAEGQGAHQ